MTGNGRLVNEIDSGEERMRRYVCGYCGAQPGKPCRPMRRNPNASGQRNPFPRKSLSGAHSDRWMQATADGLLPLSDMNDLPDPEALWDSDNATAWARAFAAHVKSGCDPTDTDWLTDWFTKAMAAAAWNAS